MAEYINLKRARFEAERYFKDKNIQDELDFLFCSLIADDVQEVRHGHWYWYEELHSFYMDDYECGWKCSYCDNYPDHDNYMADDYENKPQLRYCPNYACKMDESATDTNVGSRKE